MGRQSNNRTRKAILMSRATWSLLLVGLLTAGTACEGENLDALLAADLSTEAGDENYSGSWSLNPSKSTLPSHPGGRGGKGGPGGRGGPGGVSAAPGELVIAQTETTITFSHGDGKTMSLPLDGSVVKRDLGDGRSVSARAGWRDGHLVIERTNARGGTLSERFSINADRTELTISMTVPWGNAAVVRVFDRR